MKGILRITDASGDHVYELPPTLTTLGNGPADLLQVKTNGYCQSLLSFEFKRATWCVCIAENAALTVNVEINSARPKTPASTLLNHLDTITLGEVTMQFFRVLDEPLCNGVPCRELPLGLGELTFGRKHESEPAGPHRAELDAEDTGISRNAAVIEQEGADYFLLSPSQHGLELNGVEIQRAKLVFGDRFRIGGYIFEYTGSSVRRILPELAGSVEARGLTVVRGKNKILDNVSIHITAGEFIGILGRSGQGKSTFLNALCGVSPATSGEVRIGGVPLADRERLRELGIGYVPQDDIVHKELTVRDAIGYSAKLRLKLPKHQRDALVERVLEQLDLSKHALKTVAQLSGGQRKRVSIAIELLAKPSVLFLDEPSSGLDPAMEAELMTLLQSLTLTKLTVVCTTHVLHKAFLFNRVVWVEGGRLIFAGTSDQARRHFRTADGTATATATATLEHSPLEKIYTLLQENEKEQVRTAAEWEALYQASEYHRNLCPDIPPTHLLTAPSSRAAKPRVGALKTLTLLAARQWSILRSDVLNIAFLFAQPLLIGTLVGWVAEESALRMFLCVVATMWFGCSNGAQQIVSEVAIFRRERVCGQSMNAYILSKLGFLSFISLIQGILLLATTLAAAHIFHSEKYEEEDLKKRFAERLKPYAALVAERDTPQEEFGGIVDGDDPLDDPKPAAQTPAAPTKPTVEPPSPAKISALISICHFFQITDNVLDSGPRELLHLNGDRATDAKGKAIILPGMSLSGVMLTTLGLRLLAIVAATLVSVAIGLTISSLVKNTTQAVLWVPLVLIPQILFGGIVVAVPDMAKSVRNFSRVMPSFSAQRIMDVGSIFGVNTPKLSNRTKTPVFLSALGKTEDVEWTEDGETRTQSYDKVSPVNASWQNLAVLADRLGQHKAAHEIEGDENSAESDDVEGRRDVILRKGTPYRSTAEAQSAGAALGLWMAACYAVMLLGLAGKQTGK